MAPRSMVRMPPDSCSAGPPVVASGSDVSAEVGWDWGWGWRGLAPYIDALAGGVKPPSAALVANPLRHMVVGAEIAESRHRRLELQLHRAGRAVALLADDDLGLAVHQRPLGLPLQVLFAAGPRLLVAQVIFFAEHEQHHVGVLFDRAGFTQVRELRALVVAAFDLTRKLRQRHDRHVQLL